MRIILKQLRREHYLNQQILVDTFPKKKKKKIQINDRFKASPNHKLEKLLSSNSLFEFHGRHENVAKVTPKRRSLSCKLFLLIDNR